MSAEGPCEVVDQSDERLERVLRAPCEAADGCFGEHRFPHGTAVATCTPAQLVERAVADATRWRVHGALEGGVVMSVRCQAQVSQGVLDFSAFEEAQAAVDTVGQVALNQLFFEVA